MAEISVNPAVIDFMTAKNGIDYNLRKASEECIELGLALLQKINKPNAVDDQEIIDEIGDVIIRVEILKRLYPHDKIMERIALKTKKYEGYIEQNSFSKF